MVPGRRTRTVHSQSHPTHPHRLYSSAHPDHAHPTTAQQPAHVSTVTRTHGGFTPDGTHRSGPRPTRGRRRAHNAGRRQICPQNPGTENAVPLAAGHAISEARPTPSAVTYESYDSSALTYATRPRTAAMKFAKPSSGSGSYTSCSGLGDDATKQAAS